jgi:hypothetical protein
LQQGGTDLLSQACEAIRTAPDGQKHHVRNKWAFTIGGIADRDTEYHFLESLLEAAMANTKSPAEARRDIEAAFKEGMRKPLGEQAKLPLAMAQLAAPVVGDSRLDDIERDLWLEPMEQDKPEELVDVPVIELKVGNYTQAFVNEGAFIAIAGQAKSRKSFFLRSLLQAVDGTKETFGEVSFIRRAELPVWYFDTEQTRKELKMARREMPTSDRVKWGVLRKVKAQEALAFLTRFLLTAEKGIIFIDSILDLFDFNDQVKAGEFQNLIIDYVDRTQGVVFVVIHMNFNINKQAAGKMQGHTGSFLYRKAHFVIDLSKNGDGWNVPTKVTGGTARRIKPFELEMTIQDSAPVFAWKTQGVGPAPAVLPVYTALQQMNDSGLYAGQKASARDLHEQVTDYYQNLGMAAPSRVDVELAAKAAPHFEAVTYRGNVTRRWKGKGEDEYKIF